jgi:geranylgeranyl reductase family protein
LKKFDVIICGAGPAGLTASLVLGGAGLKVALIEKETSPGNKVCGDAIAAYVPKVLTKICPEFSSAWERCDMKTGVNTCRISTPGGKALELKYSESGFICRRNVFDTLLFDLVKQQRGITVLTGTKVSDIRADEQHVDVKTIEDQVFRGRLVIGCDGAGSITGRRLAEAKTDLNHCSAAIRAYFKNVKDMPPLTFELHFLKDTIPGYFWIFPLPDDIANVGLGLPSRVIADKKINLKDKMFRIIKEEPGLKARFADVELTGAPEISLLPLGSHKVTVSGDRFMLCGDAASLIDPATGEGIGHAVLSGRYAAWQAMRCFEENDFSASFMKGYDKSLYAKLWKHNHRRYLIRKIIVARPFAFNSLAALALKNKFILKAIKNAMT